MKFLLALLSLAWTAAFADSTATAPSVVPQSQSKTIVFIHGLFLNNKSWEPWMQYFESKGYKCYAPAYRFHAGDPDSLRKHIDPNLGKFGFQTLVDDLAGFIDSLPEKPILIGHSLGGLLVQKLVYMGKASAGVAIDAGPPKGIFSYKWSFLKSNLPVINALKGDKPFIPTVEWFHYAFCNNMTLEETQKQFNAFVVPESRNLPRGSRGAAGYVDFAKPHAPLLFIAGEQDHIVPPSLNMKNFKAYTDKSSKIDFKEFPGRTHYICAEAKWEEVASYADGWIESLGK